MLKIAQVTVLNGHEAAAIALAAGTDTQVSRGGGQTFVTTKCNDLGQISASAQAAFDALQAAGYLGLADNPGLPASGLANSMRAYGV